ncbi:glycosyltransferase [Micromonospora sp. NPDC050980]|uniref:glycosyltransferase family 2 protein n=1 Tax=Micromonospora sp. NPDC050980 TaxID=3155161 RepID=UPI0033E0A86F
MSVSVVIPTVLRSPTVGRCVRAAGTAAARCGPDAEVILVVNGPDAPPAPAAVPDAPRLRVLRSAATAVSAARNDGVAAARHDTVLFVDDDLVVPADWCRRMAAALHAVPAVAAVAAPVRTAAVGPMTAFLQHERAFDARPLSAGRAATLVTANAGYRRDVFAGPPFDPDRYPEFGEDTDLGLRIRAAGGAIAWAAGGEAPVHEVAENPASVLRRALRQGAGSARVYLQRRSLDYYLPAPRHAYDALVSGSRRSWRRYAEVTDPAARSVFVTVGLLRQAAMLIGYLDELGRSAGVELVECDEPALIRELTDLVAHVVEEARVGAGVWPDLPVRFARPAAAASDRTAAPPLAAIGRALHRFARPVPGARVPAALARDELSWLARRDRSTADFTARLASSADADAPTPTTLEAAGRAAGLALGEACLAWENGLGSAPRRWPGGSGPASWPVQSREASPCGS